MPLLCNFLTLFQKGPRFGLLLFFVLLASTSLAGSYVVGYSGGVATDSTGTARNYAGAYSGSATVYGLLGGTATCQGQVTATFTWNGGASDPPPAFVVFSVTSLAAAEQEGGIAPIALADDGLGDAATGPTSNRQSAGTHYFTKNNPGSSFTYSFTPYASFYAIPFNGFARFVFNPPPLGGCQVSCSAQVVASAAIKLSGDMGDNPVNPFLIGQKVTAGLVLSSNLTASNYSWTSGGGTPFADYVADVTQGTLVPAPSTQTTATFGSYYATAGAVSLSCAVTLTYGGSLPPGQTTLTLQKQFSTVRPTVVATYNDSYGSVGVVENLALAYYLDPVKDPNPHAGDQPMMFSAHVQTQYPINGNYGSWNYVQIWHMVRKRTLLDGTKQTAKSELLSVMDGLDNDYPYSPGGAANGTSYPATDSPEEDMVKSEAKQYSVTDSYEMYVMYLPPGASSRYVPVHQYKWQWGGTATLDQAGTTWSGVAGPKGVTSSLDSTSHPVWDSSNIHWPQIPGWLLNSKIHYYNDAP